MRTLADAWHWYETTSLNLWRMKRLAEKHWTDTSLEAVSIWQDDHFKQLEATAIITETTESLKPINDLAILVLFSVFERRVRDFLLELIKPEAQSIANPILKEAAEDAVTGIKEGSFFHRVLEPLRIHGLVPDDLITQIRRYRNWVAHGPPISTGSSIMASNPSTDRTSNNCDLP